MFDFFLELALSLTRQVFYKQNTLQGNESSTGFPPWVISSDWESGSSWIRYDDDRYANNID